MSTTPLGAILGDSTTLVTATESAALLFIKVLLLISGLLYISFGFIVIRQIVIMRKTLITPFSPLIQLLGWVHLAVATVVFIFFLVI